jgi:hypothetical protein
VPVDQSRLRSRVWLPGVAAAVVLVVLMAVVVISASGHGNSAQPPTQTPSQAQITRVMQNTTLSAEPLEHFVPAGPLKTVPDGSGGTLTAAVGTVVPTTDGMGQLVFFWHNTRFIGWDAPDESMSIIALQSAGAGRFRVTYSNYTSDDPACCPSLVPISVLYRWRGGEFAQDGSPPSVRPIPARVRFSG